MNNNNPNNQPPAPMPNGNASAAPPKRRLPTKEEIIARRRRAADPLVASRKPQKKPVSKPVPRETLVPDKDGLRRLTGVTSGPSVPKMSSAKDNKEIAEFTKQRAANKGWGEPAPPGSNEFPVFTTKRAMKEAMHFHVMRLVKPLREDGEPDIDPTNNEQFTRPVSLHRRDARQPPPGRAVKPDEEDEAIPEDEVEAERQAQIKAEKEAQKAIDRAQIAPSINKDGKKPVAKKDKPFVNGGVKSSKIDPALQEVRYAEALPWHLEDADGKNVWVGSYVQSLSNAHVAFVVQGTGFTMVPMDKYYRFNSKPPFVPYTLDEAEKILNKKVPPGRWAKRDEEKAVLKEEATRTRYALGGRPRVKGESATSRARNATERFERDELDLEGDGAFSDDDEMVGLEQDNDEDAKESRERQRKDHLGANLFGEADEKEVEKQESLENQEQTQRQEHGRHLRKALIKLEGHGDYLEEDDDFDDSSEEEEEKKKEEEQKKEEEKTDENKDKADGDVTMSGTLKPKAADKKGKSLKRPGSPNLSDSSGNESSRKKKQKKDPGASVRASRAGTPSLGRKAGGAASDGEGTAGEMSDGGTKGKGKKKAALGVGTGPRGTPAGSRAGSPAPSGARATSPGSPLASPTAGSSSTPAQAPITMDDIRTEMENFHSQGITGVGIAQLLRRFGRRVGDGPGQMPRKQWISMVKVVCRFGEDRLMYLR